MKALSFPHRLALRVAQRKKAQIFQPNRKLNGAIFGNIAGAIIGNNSGHRTGEGALIGTVRPVP